jgi:hypothetical protein
MAASTRMAEIQRRDDLPIVTGIYCASEPKEDEEKNHD